MRDTIDMAREAGAIHIHKQPKEFAIVGNGSIKAFEALVRADALANIDPSKFMSYQEAFEAGRLAEREACAKVLDEMAEDMEREMEPSTAIAYVRSKAATIRARGETK